MSRATPDGLPAFLRECFDYFPETGDLIWRIRPRAHFATDAAHAAFSTRRAGFLVRSKNNGYFRVCMRWGERRLSLYAHQIIWCWVHGVLPRDLIDHRDGDTFNNRFLNLREANHSQNNSNCGPRAGNRLGVKGVSMTREGRFSTQINFNNKHFYLGTFATAAEASAKFDSVSRLMRGEFARMEKFS